jgi:hypothetical protein
VKEKNNYSIKPLNTSEKTVTNYNYIVPKTESEFLFWLAFPDSRASEGKAMLGILDILVRILIQTRIPGSEP